ncbi:hypothetical protein L345_16636, partial [Ophiophagus hannah]
MWSTAVAWSLPTNSRWALPSSSSATRASSWPAPGRSLATTGRLALSLGGLPARREGERLAGGGQEPWTVTRGQRNTGSPQL